MKIIDDLIGNLKLYEKIDGDKNLVEILNTELQKKHLII